MKKILILFLLFLPMLTCAAQKRAVKPQYGIGTVPMVNGYVQFDSTFHVSGKSKAQLMELLQDYVQKNLVEGPEQLPQARLTEVSPESGVIAASIEEYMYFKRTNWQIHRVRFYYQLVFTVSDGKFDVMMRRLHYRYDPEVTAGDFDDDRRAENWITDDAALTKNGTRLARISGKFRTHTIDRKNEIFKQAALATDAKVKKMKWVEVEE